MASVQGRLLIVHQMRLQTPFGIMHTGRMPHGTRSALRTLGALLLFAAAVYLFMVGGQAFFSPPDMAAREVGHWITGAYDGPVKTVLFGVFAALYVGVIGLVLLAITLPLGHRRPLRRN